MTHTIEVLFADYRAAIYEFIRRRVQMAGTSNEAAEDLTQECFRKAFEALQRGVEVDNASAWLHQIARRLIIDWYRYRQRRPRTVSLDDCADEPAHDLSPYEQAASNIGCEVIWGAVRCLTDKQAEIMHLQAQGGYTGPELAAETGTTLAATKQLLGRSRAKLRHVFTTGEGLC